MVGAGQPGAHESDALLAMICLDNKKKMACLMCVLYMILVKSHLSDLDVVCGHYGSGDEGLFQLVDYIFMACILCIIFVLVVGCGMSEFVRPSKAFLLRNVYVVTVLLLFAAGLASMVQLSVTQGTCGLGEALRFGVPTTLVMLATPSVHLFLRRPTYRKLLLRMEAMTWSKAEQEKQETRQACMEPRCAICLSDWEQGDEIRITPCSHPFHEKCVKRWLVTQARDRCGYSCAMCRQKLAAPAARKPREEEERGSARGAWRWPSRWSSRAWAAEAQDAADRDVANAIDAIERGEVKAAADAPEHDGDAAALARLRALLQAL